VSGWASGRRRGLRFKGGSGDVDGKFGKCEAGIGAGEEKAR
jgi:hypothetical protein